MVTAWITFLVLYGIGPAIDFVNSCLCICEYDARMNCDVRWGIATDIVRCRLTLLLVMAMIPGARWVYMLALMGFALMVGTLAASWAERRWGR
jgi:hypothetical protein